MALSAGGALVLYDGVCPLCSRAVRFILPRDPKGVFRFASLESPLGRELLRSRDLPADADTMVLLESDRTSLRSDAVLRILARMRFPWRLFAAFIIVPRPIRDAIYRAIARRRYRLLGGPLTSCPVPPPRYRDRFLG